MLVVASLAATLAATEVALRLLFRGDVERVLTTRRRQVAPDADSVLCVGDSYTFGIYYRPDEVYPGRLEQLLNAGTSPAAGGRPRWFVENGGIPAQNSGQVEARLPEQLARWRPKMVVVLVGFNDRWNVAAPAAEMAKHGTLRSALEGLVIVKFARLVLASGPGDGRKLDGRTRFEKLDSARIEVVGEDGATGIDIERGGKLLMHDAHFNAVARRLESMVATIRAADALPFLCSYPSPEPRYEPPSRAAADVAQRLHVPFVDLRAVFARELEIHAYPELLIPGDRHPTDRGYWRMATEIARAMAESGAWQPVGTLRDELPSVAARGYSLTGLSEQLYPVSLESAPGSAEARTFTMTGPPDARWMMLVSGSDSPSQHFGSLELKLAADELFASSLNHEGCEGAFDAAGHATWSLPQDLAKAGFVALAVLHDLLVPEQDLQVRGLAGPLPLR